MLSEVIKKSAKNMEVGKMKTRKIILADLDKTDLEEQIKKISEEVNEVKVSYNLLNTAKLAGLSKDIIKKREEELISELYDMIQAGAGALWIIENGVSMNNEHIEKIEEYVDSGRINNEAKEVNNETAKLYMQEN